jgi:predicted ATPase
MIGGVPMITKIEIDGFKSFYKFSLDIQPFQVIVGPNAAGKSNLFDALMLLSRLADRDLRSAFQESRGDAGELFTLLPNDDTRKEMFFGVELLLDPIITDSWGDTAEVTHTRVRYEVKIIRETDERGLDHLKIEHESLTPILAVKDYWATKEIRKNRLNYFKYKRQKDLISTELNHESGRPTVILRQDGRSGRQRISVRDKMESTLLSGLNNTEFPIAFAVREELRGWRFLQLSPEALRTSESRIASDQLSPSGQFLANMLARLKKEDPYLLNDISADLSNLVSGAMEVEIEEDAVRDRYIIWLKSSDGRRFSSRVLSDGTLRMLALTSFKYDNAQGGVILFEEPENGVHPFRIERLVPLLRDIATNFTELDIQENQKLRQLILNTHSTKVLAQLEDSEMVFAHIADSIVDGHSMRVTRMSPVFNYLISADEKSFTRLELERYLDKSDLEEAIRKRGTLQ